MDKKTNSRPKHVQGEKKLQEKSEIKKKVEREGPNSSSYFEMKHADAVDVVHESTIEETKANKTKMSNDLNFGSCSEPRESAFEGIKLLETKNLREKSGNAHKENNKLNSTEEPPKKMSRYDVEKSQTMEKESFNRFYLKCQENARKNILDNHAMMLKKQEKKAKYFEDTQDWEHHIKELKIALTETYLKKKENETKLKINQEDSIGVEEMADSGFDNNIRRDKALPVPTSLPSQKANVSTIKEKRGSDEVKIKERLSPREQEQNTSTEKEMNFQSKKSEAPSKQRDSIESLVSVESKKSEDYNEFSKFVEKVEKEFKEYLQCKEEVGKIRKAFCLMQNKMYIKQRLLILKKLNAEEKIKQTSTKFAKISKTLKEQGHSRASELLDLKLREVDLRSQITFHKVLKEVPESSGMKINKIPTQRPCQKKIIDFSDCDKIDPSTPLCPYDLSGLCNDDECKYQHIVWP